MQNQLWKVLPKLWAAIPENQIRQNCYFMRWDIVLITLITDNIILLSLLTLSFSQLHLASIQKKIVE